jgi:peptidoglycan-associated lipoprotein
LKGEKMLERVNARLVGTIFFAFLFVLSGCPKSTPTTQGDAGGAGSQGAQAGKGQPQSKTGEGNTSGGSLSEASQGKSQQPGPLKEVYFAFDSFDLQPDARATLKTNADWLKANQSSRVEIEGHSDERGTNEYNLALGAKRAQAAKDYLVTLGIPAERLSTISYGEELPVCKEQTEDCWQKNRRDRFVVTGARPAS